MHYREIFLQRVFLLFFIETLKNEKILNFFQVVKLHTLREEIIRGRNFRGIYFRDFAPKSRK